MTYSCSDFVDTILDSLKVYVPEESADDPSAQADLALDAVEGLRAQLRAMVHVARVMGARQQAGLPVTPAMWKHLADEAAISAPLCDYNEV